MPTGAAHTITVIRPRDPGRREDAGQDPMAWREMPAGAAMTPSGDGGPGWAALRRPPHVLINILLTLMLG